MSQETCRNGYFVDLEAKEPRQQLSDWTRDYNMSHGHMCPAVDNIEELTGLDFFYSLPDDIENIAESDSNLSKWN